MRYLFYPLPKQSLLPLPKVILVTIAYCCHLRPIAATATS